MTATTTARRPHGPYAHMVPREQLKKAIERHLEDNPCMLWDLTLAFDYSQDTIRARLLELQAEGRVHRIETTHPRTNNKGWLWCAGPEPEADIGEPDVDDAPHQVTTKHYPLIGRSDPLVAALYGSARQVAP